MSMSPSIDLPLWNVKVCEDGAVSENRPLNATAASLLGFLHRGVMTGWDLHATAEACIGGFWTVTRSQVYRELASLTKAGMVEEGAVGARAQKPFTITDLGRTAFAEWVDRDPGDATIRHPLLLTMAFGDHLDPDRLRAVLTAHRDASSSEMSEFDSATLDFGIRYEQATLEWFDALPQRFQARS
jgi:DNA-binding PadR family transcriptional regulator